MALTVTALSAEPRSWSTGPWKQQVLIFSVANGDTSGTITADSLSSAQACVVGGLEMTAQPTFSGNVITLAFADPLATRHCQIIVYGR